MPVLLGGEVWLLIRVVERVVRAIQGVVRAIEEEEKGCFICLYIISQRPAFSWVIDWGREGYINGMAAKQE